MKTELLCLYLMKCSINKQKPESLPSFDMDALWSFTNRHSVSATVAKTLLDNQIIQDENWHSKWQEVLQRNIRKTMLFDAERAKVERQLDSLGIWHVPLKGIIVNKLYPNFGLRQFADNDILVENGHREEIRQMMSDIGYTEHVTFETDDSFKKNKILNMEIHYKLFKKKKNYEVFNNYYKDIASRFVPDGDSPYSLKLTNEDFFVYFLAHAYRHFREAGIGIRLFADVYVYRKSIKMDEAYVEGELKKLKIFGFGKTIVSISEKIFSPDSSFKEEDLTEEEAVAFNSIVNSYTYGSFEQMAENRYIDYVLESGKTGKSGYYFRRFFPSMEDHKHAHPFIYRHKILYPAFYIYRPFRGLIKNRQGLSKEIKAVRQTKKKNDKN